MAMRESGALRYWRRLGMGQRTCKRCSQPYDDRARKCPVCGATNVRIGWIPWLLLLAMMALFLELIIILAR